MGSRELHFPDYFPEGCPPKEAKAEDCVLFRVCENDILTEVDFKSHYLKNPKKFKNNILAYGLSVYKNIEDCRKLRAKVPRFRKHKIANGMVSKDMGKIMKSESEKNPGHHTWWVYEGVKPHTFFSIYDESGEQNG